MEIDAYSDHELSDDLPKERKDGKVIYAASPTLWGFHHSRALVRVARGPVGSGKSTSCCWEIWNKASSQRPDGNGKRLSAWVVVRNTYRELKDTTLATWLDWFSESRIGRFNYADMEHRIEYGDLECLIMFRALDRPQDVKKVLSLEVTGAWFNEARETPRTIVNRMAERIGRYPPRSIVRPTWRGIIMDTNPPDDDHWLAEAERDPPKGWEFFVQPPGLIHPRDEYGNVDQGSWITNPDAENLRYLDEGYYERNLGNMKLDEIKVYRANEFGFIIDGKPATPEFVPATHAVSGLQVDPDQPLVIGLDVGGGTLSPAAILFQRHKRGPYLVHAEVIGSEIGLDRFSVEIKQCLAERFPSHLERLERWVQGGSVDTDEAPVRAVADPAGAQRDQLYETVVFDHLRSAIGCPVRPAPSQDPKVRLDALRAPMTRMIDGKPGILVDKRCKTLIKGLSGGWCYKRLAVSGERYADRTDKGIYSHPCEALGYGLLGAGEMRTLRAVAEAVQPKRVVRPARWVV